MIVMVLGGQLPVLAAADGVGGAVTSSSSPRRPSSRRSLVLDLLRRSRWPRVARAARVAPVGRAARIGRCACSARDGDRARRRRHRRAAAAATSSSRVVVGVLIAYGLYRMVCLHRRHGRLRRRAHGVRRRRGHVRAGRGRWWSSRRWSGCRSACGSASTRGSPGSRSRSCRSSPASRPTSCSRSRRSRSSRPGVSLNVGGILLMSLGAQWYILFNTIAGAMADPLRPARGDGRPRRARLAALAAAHHPRRSSPRYVTGGITASGGAWNASIVAEIVTYGGTTPDGHRPRRLHRQGHRDRRLPQDPRRRRRHERLRRRPQPAVLAAPLPPRRDEVLALTDARRRAA